MALNKRGWATPMDRPQCDAGGGGRLWPGSGAGLLDVRYKEQRGSARCGATPACGWSEACR